MTQTIEFSRIGVLERISQGGQGAVYKAPNVAGGYAKSMVFKEYHDGRGGKPNVLSSLNVAALKAMPAFLESLPYKDGAKLISVAAWPCRVVEDNQVVRGFVMPSIPDEFFIDFSTAKGTSRVAAEFQHLLNDPQIVAMRLQGRIITDREKYELLRQVATALAFLHSHNVCVGDISPKNLLYSLSPTPAIYFIDCDAMRINGVSLTHQLETPAWEVPSGEEKATTYSDRYKLGLLALRLILGDQDARDPSRLPSSVPTQLRKVITDTLEQPPSKRPALSVWESVLDQARISAPVQPKTGPIPKPKNNIRPVSAHSGSPSPQKLTQAPRVQPRPLPPTVPGPSPQRTAATFLKTNGWWLPAAGAILLFILVRIVSGSSESGPSASRTTTTYTTPTTTYETTYSTSAPTTRSTPTLASRPPSVTGLDMTGEDCDSGYYLTDKSGWANRSLRGSDRTSCQFTLNTLRAYWTQVGTPSRAPQRIYVEGAVRCDSVRGTAGCAPDGYLFEMSCNVVLWSQEWITCTGGKDARVYLY